MSALLRDLRVGQWIYADSLGSKPGCGGLMGKIICLAWTKDQQVAVLGGPGPNFEDAASQP